MGHVRARSALFGWLMVALVPVGGLADDESPQPSIEAYLPTDVLAAVVVPDPKALTTQFPQCPLGALFAAAEGSPSSPASAAPSPARRWARAVKAFEQEIAIPATDLLSMGTGPVALALISVNAPTAEEPSARRAEEGSDGNGTGRPDTGAAGRLSHFVREATWAVVARLEGDTAPARHLITRTAAALARTPGGTTRRGSVGKTPVLFYGSEADPAGAAIADNILVMSNRKAGLAAVLAAVLRTPKEGLASTAWAADLKKHIESADALLVGYVNLRALNEAWLDRKSGVTVPGPFSAIFRRGDRDRPWHMMAAAAPGVLEAARALAFTVGIENRVCRDTVVVALEGDREPLQVWPAAGRARDLLTSVPATVDVGAAACMDAAVVWDRLDIVLRSRIDPATYGRIHEALARLTQQIGFDLRGDLLAATGTNWVLIGLESAGLAEPTAPDSPDAILERLGTAVSVRDRGRLLRCLTALREALARGALAPPPRDAAAPGAPPITVKQFKIGEQTVDYCLLRDVPTLSPSVAVTPQGQLVITSTTTAMQRMLASLGRSEQSLAADPAFVALAGQVDGEAPAVGAVSFRFLAALLGAEPGKGIPAPHAGGTDRFSVFSIRLAGPASLTSPPSSAASHGGNLVIRSRGPASLVLAAGMAAMVRVYAPPDDGASARTRPVSVDGTDATPESRPTAPPSRGDAR